MSYATKNAEILALFTAAGKEIPHEDSDMGRSIAILTTICDGQSHTIPKLEDVVDADFTQQEIIDNVEQTEVLQVLEELENNLGYDDFTIEFDGNEYRLIKESVIWEIYVAEIKNTVEDCYDLNLDKVPAFIALSIDWEQTAKNAYVDGYGHQFSSYDGSEEEAAGFYIFRTN